MDAKTFIVVIVIAHDRVFQDCCWSKTIFK